MGYAVLDPDELEAWDHPDRECELRSISHATELSNLGANLFDADPGEQLPLACHFGGIETVHTSIAGESAIECVTAFDSSEITRSRRSCSSCSRARSPWRPRRRS